MYIIMISMYGRIYYYGNLFDEKWAKFEDDKENITHHEIDWELSEEDLKYFLLRKEQQGNWSRLCSCGNFKVSGIK